MARTSSWTTEDLIRLVDQYVEKPDRPLIINATDLARFVNEELQMQPKVGYYTFNRRKEVKEYIERYNRQAAQQVASSSDNTQMAVSTIDLTAIAAGCKDKEAFLQAMIPFAERYEKACLLTQTREEENRMLQEECKRLSGQNHILELQVKQLRTELQKQKKEAKTRKREDREALEKKNRQLRACFGYLTKQVYAPIFVSRLQGNDVLYHNELDPLLTAEAERLNLPMEGDLYDAVRAYLAMEDDFMGSIHVGAPEEDTEADDLQLTDPELPSEVVDTADPADELLTDLVSEVEEWI